MTSVIEKQETQTLETDKCFSDVSIASAQADESLHILVCDRLIINLSQHDYTPLTPIRPFSAQSAFHVQQTSGRTILRSGNDRE